MNEQNRETLSEAGRARRDAMLGSLLREMREVHAQRRMRRRAAVMASAGVAFALIVVIVLPKPPSPPARDGGTVAVDSPADVAPLNRHDLDRTAVVERADEPKTAAIVKVVHTDPATMDRYIVRTGSHRAIVLNDEELIDTLAAIGRPTGLVRMDGKVWLTAKVTDEDLNNGL